MDIAAQSVGSEFGVGDAVSRVGVIAGNEGGIDQVAQERQVRIRV